MSELKAKTHYVNVRIRTTDNEIRTGWVGIDINENINCAQFAEVFSMAAEAYEAYIKDHPEEGKKLISFNDEHDHRKVDIDFRLFKNSRSIYEDDMIEGFRPLDK